MSEFTDAHPSSRRTFLRIGTAAGGMLALGALPTFSAHADIPRPATTSLVPPGDATALWYPRRPKRSDHPAGPAGRQRPARRAWSAGIPARLALPHRLTFWTGGLNAPSSRTASSLTTPRLRQLTLLAKVGVDVPAHAPPAVTDYRRQLDLSNGVVTATYRQGGVTYRREVYASHPDDVRDRTAHPDGGGSYTGSRLAGRNARRDHGRRARAISFAGALDNGLKYASGSPPPAGRQRCRQGNRSPSPAAARC